MSGGVKTIFHLDLDCFFVAAERLSNSTLRNRPVAVGGDGPRGVVSSASYEARKFGVRSAMPTSRALKLCPTLVLVSGNYSLYSALSKKVFGIVANYTPVHEATGIDEGYLDMSGTERLHGPPLAAAATLRKRILDETGLTVSIGIASNRLVAKVATDQCKPDNVLFVEPGHEAAFLAPLGVEKLPGCGRVTQEWLKSRDLKTIAQLQRYPLELLERHLGSFGAYLHDAAWGRGSTEFNEEPKSRSTSRERTFGEDIAEPERLKRVLWEMAVELGAALRKDGDHARVMRLKLRYPPFQTVLRSRTLKAPTQLDRALYEAAVELFDDHWERGSALRLLGMGCVLGEGTRQLGLFEDVQREERDRRIDDLKDHLTRKFGEKALRTGRDLE